jgi:hypothetical protein
MGIEMSSTLINSHEHDGMITGVPTLRTKLAKAQRRK